MYKYTTINHWYINSVEPSNYWLLLKPGPGPGSKP